MAAPNENDPRGAGRALSTELLLHRLRSVATLSPRETELVLSLGEKPKQHAPGTTICPHEDGSPHPRLMVSGWACRPRVLPDGRRQMLGLLLPGDLMGDRGERRPFALNPVVTLTPARTISIARLVSAVRDAPEHHPGLVRALAVFDRIEENGLIDHVVRLGCQSAIQRLAHLLLELHQRLSAIGFVHDGSYPLPLTQDTLGELLGLSLVHVNRIVAQLRREKLAAVRLGTAKIHDFARIALLADRMEPSRDGAVA